MILGIVIGTVTEANTRSRTSVLFLVSRVPVSVAALPHMHDLAVGRLEPAIQHRPRAYASLELPQNELNVLARAQRIGGEVVPVRTRTGGRR